MKVSELRSHTEDMPDVPVMARFYDSELGWQRAAVSYAEPGPDGTLMLVIETE